MDNKNNKIQDKKKTKKKIEKIESYKRKALERGSLIRK